MLEYYKELIFYVQKMVGDKESAKDITQETYRKVVELENNNKIDYSNIRALLYKIAKNIVIDNFRKEKKISQIEFEDNSFCTSKEEQPEEIALEMNHYENLIKIVDTLPKRTKEAFILHAIDGYKRKEIASMMGISVSAVEKHIIRATTKLQEKIKSH